jgi:hypothetical protein
MLTRLAVAPAFALILSACASAPGARAPDLAFGDGLLSVCGQSFEGRVVSTDAVDDEWRAARLVMHVRDCAPGMIRVPLSVGEDRSRTWVLSATGEGGAWELRHIHRKENGSLDPLTQYGGFSVSDPGATRQEFPADQATKDLFDREDIPVSKANIWAVEVKTGENLFAYELRRPERFFRVEFDLSRPVETPPPHWAPPPPPG